LSHAEDILISCLLDEINFTIFLGECIEVKSPGRLKYPLNIRNTAINDLNDLIDKNFVKKLKRGKINIYKKL
jgi:hypothetical protein